MQSGAKHSYYLSSVWGFFVFKLGFHFSLRIIKEVTFLTHLNTIQVTTHLALTMPEVPETTA